MRRTLTFLVAAALAMVALTGCGGDNKVGDKSLLNFKEEAGQRGLGETTTTTAAPTTTTAARSSSPTTGPAGGKAGTATTATTKPTAVIQPTVTTATTTAAAGPKPDTVSLEILIQSDNDPAPIEPAYGRVFVNSIVRWINKDSVPRSIAAVSGQFRSPTIPPGGHYDYKATTAGVFDYGDGTRPYVNATLEVLAS
jgi:plastocyanin